MDYDATDIPAAYDRGRDHGPAVLDLWMRAIAAHVEEGAVETILDLGCGTGRFSEALAARFEAKVIGIDPSTKMLRLAREKLRDDRVEYREGRAEAIPLPSQSVDLIFMSMCFHHFSDAGTAVAECRRVLREGGAAVLRTGTREQIAAYPYVPFFPSSRSLLEEVLPHSVEVSDVFRAAQFHKAAAELVVQTIAVGWAAYAEKLAAGGDSVLARLSREELDQGLAALRGLATPGDVHAVVEPIDLFVFR